LPLNIKKTAIERDMDKKRVCPVERAGHLDNKFRRWLQNPQKILSPYIKEGMTALDLGCGPGFFSVDMAHMVGKSGRVIASDLQDAMLEKLRSKIYGTKIEDRIEFHKCEEDKIGITDPVDFILAFYMVHEIPDQDVFFKEIESLLKTNGVILIVEPPFHVSRKAFNQTLERALEAGLIVAERPGVLFSKAVAMKKRPRQTGI
jgi:ubiquinone/menaquinone biosynthesis C-methylase UbiE